MDLILENMQAHRNRTMGDRNIIRKTGRETERHKHDQADKNRIRRDMNRIRGDMAMIRGTGT